MKEEYDSKRSSHKESYLGSRPSTGFSYFMFIFAIRFGYIRFIALFTGQTLSVLQQQSKT